MYYFKFCGIFCATVWIATNRFLWRLCFLLSRSLISIPWKRIQKKNIGTTSVEIIYQFWEEMGFVSQFLCLVSFKVSSHVFHISQIGVLLHIYVFTTEPIKLLKSFGESTDFLVLWKYQALVPTIFRHLFFLYFIKILNF